MPVPNYPESPERDGYYYDYLQQGRKLAFVAFVLGVAGCVCWFSSASSLPGVIFGVIGWVIGSRARRMLPPAERGLATAGWILSIIAVFLCAFVFIFFGGLIALFGLAAIIGL